MKTKGMTHQVTALARMAGRTAYALFMEQGTGKTWTLLADAERLYAAGKIDALLVVAPKGVHNNWVKREIPAHVDAHVVARAWRSGGEEGACAHRGAAEAARGGRAGAVACAVDQHRRADDQGRVRLCAALLECHKGDVRD